MLLCEQGTLEKIVKLLEVKHMNVNAKDDDGDNALVWALSCEDDNKRALMIEKLIAKHVLQTLLT